MSKTEPSHKKKDILKKYASLVKTLKRDVTHSDLKAAGISRDNVTRYFGNMAALEEEARRVHPSSFFNVSLEILHSPKALAALKRDVSKSNRFVITTAVTGCKIDDAFHSALKRYCAINEAKLLILVSSDPAGKYTGGNKSWGTIDAKLQNEVVLEDTKLNSNFFISTIKLSAKHIDPITGLGRIGQRNGTFIYASPKQRLKAVPVGNKLPHFMMTTGAITTSDYSSDLYMSQRTAYIAENDHVMGAVVVEVEDNEIFHFRQVQSNSKGDFADLGIMYSKDSEKSYLPKAFILGDWHSGSTDPIAKKCWEEVCVTLKPEILVIHDGFDGRSISHHEEKDIVTRSQRADRGELSLTSELEEYAKDLNDMLKLVKKVVIVKSNHDVFLERYLREGKYVKDPVNHKISLLLASALLDGLDPLKVGVEMFLDKASAAKIKWLELDEDYKIAGVQLGAHGHAGSNGSRGSLANLEEAHGKCIVGHSHTPQILRGATQVGTSSYLKMSYVKGASSWVHTSCLLYENGSRQLINCIDGKWRLED